MESEVMTEQSDDDTTLVKMGYKKSLFRGLNGITNFSMGYVEVAVLISLVSVYDYGLSTGGSSVMISTWIVTMIMLIVVAVSLAEICGAFPSAGSVYHWAGQVVPPRWTPLASYVCGWTNFLGNAAQDASFAFTWALFLNAALIVSYSESGFKGFHNEALVGISIAVLFIWTLLNAMRIDYVGIIGYAGAICQFTSVLCLVTILLSHAPSFRTSHYVFNHYENTTGFTSKSYVCAINVLGALWSTAGYEASAHLAEETTSAKRNAPRGIIATCVATGVSGFAVLLAMLFTTFDEEELLDHTNTPDYVNSDNAAIELFRRIGGSHYGAPLAWLIVVNCFFAGVASVGITGRITFALARDGAFPFSATMSTVQSRAFSPLNALLAVFVFDVVLQLLPLFSSVAFYSLTGISTIGFQVSYAIPIGLKLLFDNDAHKDAVIIPSSGYSLGYWSKPIGTISLLWLGGTACVLFLPTEYPVTPDTMNWSVLIVGGFFIIGLVNWMMGARHYYAGPKRLSAVKSMPTTVEVDNGFVSPNDIEILANDTR